jgi:hypothetical protein
VAGALERAGEEAAQGIVVFCEEDAGHRRVRARRLQMLNGSLARHE